MPKQSNEQRYFDALKKIAKEYMTPEQLRHDHNVAYLGYEEVLSMAYDDLQAEAKAAILHRRRPKQ